MPAWFGSPPVGATGPADSARVMSEPGVAVPEGVWVATAPAGTVSEFTGAPTATVNPACSSVCVAVAWSCPTTEGTGTGRPNTWSLDGAPNSGLGCPSASAWSMNRFQVGPATVAPYMYRMYLPLIRTPCIGVNLSG